MTWSETVHGNSVGLGNSGFDALSAGGGLAVAASSLAAGSMARAYVEIVVINSDNNAEIGIKDSATSQLDEYHIDTSGSNVHYDNYEAELFSKGNGWSVQINRSQPMFRDGDVVMWALDHQAGLLWYGRNGTWLGNGDPATGANPTFRAPTTAAWFPSVYAEDGSRFQIRASAPDLNHPIPAGFQSFAAAVGLADSDCGATPGGAG